MPTRGDRKGTTIWPDSPQRSFAPRVSEPISLCKQSLLCRLVTWFAGMNRLLPPNAMLLPCTHYEIAAISHRDVTRSRNNGDLRVLTLVKLCLFITVSSASASASKNTVTFFLNPRLTLAGCDQSRRAMERQAWAMLASEPDSLRRKIKGPLGHIALAAHAI